MKHPNFSPGNGAQNHVSNKGEVLSIKNYPEVQPGDNWKNPITISELYRLVTEITNHCLWDWNIKNRHIFWIDGGHKRIFGYDIENAIIEQDFWESHLHPTDKQRVLQKLQTTIMLGAPALWEDEYRFKKADGAYAYVHDRGQIIYEHGTASRIVGATQDITARKLTEGNLIESERKLSLIAKQTVNAVIITSADGKIIWVNEAFSRITGYSALEVMYKTPGDFLQGKKTNIETVQYLRKQITTKKPFDCEIVNYTKSGHPYWVHIQGQALYDDNNNCDRFFAIQTDVTEKKRLENNLLRERRSKQKEITEAVLTAQEKERSDIGKELHDNVNQILGATKLYIEMAKTGVEKKNVYLDKAVGHVLQSIDEIRRISKRLLPQSIDIIGLSESIQILLSDLSDIHPIKIEFTEAGIDKRLISEKLQLNIFRIVQEQINNIIKHASATHTSISLTMNDDIITLRITDNGIGCDTNIKKEGVGIRNIMSRVEINNGRIDIVSIPGEGYSMKILFPVDLAAVQVY